jgi:glycosyltransferase involved in cell wall biosynthesis
MTAENPQISVVIPTLNYGRFISDALNSALRQSLRPTEIIVVDDGSSDDTQQQLAAYAGRIHYVYQNNRGVNAARNLGIRLSHGHWIAILDSDDLWHPQKLERQWAVHRQFPELAATATDSSLFFNNELPATDAVRYDGEPPLRRLSLSELVYGVHFSGGSGAMIARDCFEKTGFFDESLRGGEDFELWCRIAAIAPIARIREPLVFMRSHGVNVSSQAAKMKAYHRRTLAKLFSPQSPLHGHRRWRRIIEARFYTGTSWMHYGAGERWLAIGNLLRSIAATPAALCDANGQKIPLHRCKLLWRYLTRARS